MCNLRVKTRRRLTGVALTWLASLALGTTSAGASPTPKASPASHLRLSVTAGMSEPLNVQRLSEQELAALRANVDQNPKLRKPRLELVRALMRKGELQAAHAAAEEWRKHDAYNLVVVRLLGDIENTLDDKARSRRTYSAIVELLPRDVEARRALATVLKQAGDLQGARSQLLAALTMEKSDPRIVFELGDVEQRLGMHDSARARFESTRESADASESLRYPARQRLSQIHARALREALQNGDDKRAGELRKAIADLDIHGGTENDIKVYLSWDSDRTDVDLWVTTPGGEKVFYGKRRGSGGEELFDDVTTGYGPESFTAAHAQAGEYVVEVNYFGGGSGGLKDARGEVLVVLNEGRKDEVRKVLPYRLFEPRDTVTVARIQVVESKQ
ncbi:MAG: hypothetical protein ACOY0T_09045 [Myxococcota bacterium]